MCSNANPATLQDGEPHSMQRHTTTYFAAGPLCSPYNAAEPHAITVEPPQAQVRHMLKLNLGNTGLKIQARSDQ